jgi:hypothetical protein
MKRAMMRWHSYQPLVSRARRKHNGRARLLATAEPVHGGGGPGRAEYDYEQEHEQEQE